MTSRTGQSLPMHYLYPIWQWLVYVPVIALATVVAAVLAILTALVLSPRKANLWIGVSWGRLITALAPVRVVVSGREHIDPDQSYVVVANHQSQFDIPVIYGHSGLDLRWVAKAELRRIPFIASGCRAIGHVFVDRSDPEQARTAINRAIERLEPGTGLMFFPEGTRSRSHRLLPFKKGAFRVAIDQQLPVLPVTILGSRDVLEPDSARIRPGRVEVIIHPPIAVHGMKTVDLGELRRRTHAIIEASFQQGTSA